MYHYIGRFMDVRFPVVLFIYFIFLCKICVPGGVAKIITFAPPPLPLLGVPASPAAVEAPTVLK